MQQVHESIHALISVLVTSMQNLDTSATPTSRMSHARATYDNSLVLARASLRTPYTFALNNLICDNHS